MIYEFKDTIVHLHKCFIHFFRALFCKDYFTESHGLGMCGQYGRIDAKGKYRFCEYRWCPKRKSNADQHVQHVGSVESVEPTWTKEEHEAFYTFLWNVINPNEMQDYIEMFETTDEPQTIRCPKCGRTDYIRDMEKDMGIKGSCYKYKCINCNTYIKDEPQTERNEK